MLSHQESTEPDYFAIIKLTNSDDIIGGIVISNDDTGIHVHDPLLVKQVSVISNGVIMQKYMLTPWVVHSSDTVFFIDGYHIVTHGEMSATMFEEYTKYISSDSYNNFYKSEEEQEEEILDTTNELIEEARNKLQKLYEQ